MAALTPVHDSKVPRPVESMSARNVQNRPRDQETKSHATVHSALVPGGSKVALGKKCVLTLTAPTDGLNAITIDKGITSVTSKQWDE